VINEWQQFARDLSAAFGEDALADFCQTLVDNRRAEAEMTYARQKRIKEAAERIETAWLDGLGECHMSIDPEVFFYWVRKEGRDCWNDPGFIREFKRDNPEVIRRNRARATTILRP
jgi:hypothetical protein